MVALGIRDGNYYHVQVMEAVERFTDPLAAAKHIVQEAFRTWLRYEVRTDDITIVVIFIEDFQEGEEDVVSPNTYAVHLLPYPALVALASLP